MIDLFRSMFAPPRHLLLPLFALWIGLALAEKRTLWHGVSKEELNGVVFYSLFGYVLGGRGLYAIQNFSAFVKSPASLFSLNLDLFDPLGALVACVIVGYVYSARRGLPLWSMLDALTPLFGSLTVGIGLAHLASGTAFGSPTDMPWGIELWNARRHPTQLYELLAALAILPVLWYLKVGAPAGVTFLLFLALTAGARLVIEGFRGDSTLILGGVRLAQVIAWLVLLVALVVGELRLSSTEATM